MRVAVIRFPGTNCDLDTLRAINSVPGAVCDLVWHSDDVNLSKYDLVVLPGGFSYSDRLRAGAIAARLPVMEGVRDFAEDGGLVLGICNGFQVLVESGMLPGALLPNSNGRFVCRWVHLKVEENRGPFTNLFDRNEVIALPVAHREGRYHPQEPTAGDGSGYRVVMRYVDRSGRRTAAANPNGSYGSIAAISNREGNVLGMMPHPERACDPLLSPLGRCDGLRLFLSAANYVRGSA